MKNEIKKNKKAQKGALGFVFIILAVIFIISSFALIDPIIEFLNTARDTSSLNCPGTSGFNQVSYDNQTTLEQLTRRPTCFVTGLTLIYFIGAFFLAVLVWAYNRWRSISR